VPRVRVILFRDGDSCPFLDWLETLPEKAHAKGTTRIERLEEMGHELRRPEADYLADGIYELRWRFQSVNYRVLYFFHGREAVILSHGFTKEGRVPPREIDLAIRRKVAFQRSPEACSHEGDWP
jgi:phage-related protein